MHEMKYQPKAKWIIISTIHIESIEATRNISLKCVVQIKYLQRKTMRYNQCDKVIPLCATTQKHTTMQWAMKYNAFHCSKKIPHKNTILTRFSHHIDYFVFAVRREYNGWRRKTQKYFQRLSLFVWYNH